jgi:hypothetical protein
MTSRIRPGVSLRVLARQANWRLGWRSFPARPLRQALWPRLLDSFMTRAPSQRGHAHHKRFQRYSPADKSPGMRPPTC